MVKTNERNLGARAKVQGHRELKIEQNPSLGLNKVCLLSNKVGEKV